MVNELIKVTTSDNGELLVSGRELHEFLGVKSKYLDWFNRMIEYGFVENVDFITINELTQKKEGSRIVERTITNHHLKLDMAKEVAMIQRSDKGKQARQYFIQKEKELKQLQQYINIDSYMINDPIARAQKWIEEQKEKQQLQAQLTIAQPKADKYDKFLDADGLMSGDVVAKILGTGRNRLYEFLREQKIYKANNVPYQKYVDRGYFRVKNKITRVGIKEVTLITPKGADFIANLLSDKKDKVS